MTNRNGIATSAEDLEEGARAGHASWSLSVVPQFNPTGFQRLRHIKLDSRYATVTSLLDVRFQDFAVEIRPALKYGGRVRSLYRWKPCGVIPGCSGQRCLFSFRLRVLHFVFVAVYAPAVRPSRIYCWRVLEGRICGLPMQFSISSL